MSRFFRYNATSNRRWCTITDRGGLREGRSPLIYTKYSITDLSGRDLFGTLKGTFHVANIKPRFDVAFYGVISLPPMFSLRTITTDQNAAVSLRSAPFYDFAQRSLIFIDWIIIIIEKPKTHSLYRRSLNPFTPKCDQCQLSPAASPAILHNTVWRTWLFIAYSDGKWLH